MPTDAPAVGTAPTAPAAPTWRTWAVRVVAAAGIGVVAWVCLTAWDVVVHGHPAYAVLIAATAIVCAVVGVRSLRPRPARTGWRRAAGIAALVVGVVWIAAMAWLRPYAAVQPALDAMVPDGAATVTETATRIVLAPAAGTPDTGTGLFFQPGARVDARAYAAVLRPLAEAGHTVVVAKQPLGIAFLALPAFDDVPEDFPEVTGWVVGGHSLGGTVAAIQADADAADGLLLHASYPAGDLSELDAAVESVSGSRDGLSTPAKIDASRTDLPAAATFTVVEGASHAQFGDYGPQPGDGVPAISHDEARAQISAASLRFLEELDD